MEEIVDSNLRIKHEIYITHALRSPWKEILEQGQMLTWAPTDNERIHHVYARPVGAIAQSLDDLYWKLRWHRLPGKAIILFEVLRSKILLSSKPKIIYPKNSYTTQDVLIDMPDLYFHSNLKSLAIHRHVAKSAKKFVVLTTSSSYINEKNLMKEIEKLPAQKVIGGRIVFSGDKKFISGSFRLYTPDVLRETLANLKGYRSWLAEDLALGHLMDQKGFNFTSLKSLDIGSIGELESLTDNMLKETVHFRVKSGSLQKRNDVAIMMALHKRLQELDAI